MKKKLISAHNLEEFILGDKGILTVGPDHILSPGARDAARNRGISIVYGRPEPDAPSQDGASGTIGPGAPAPEDRPAPAGGGSDPSQDREILSRKIISLLSKEFGLTDPETIEAVTLGVLKRILDTNEK